MPKQTPRVQGFVWKVSRRMRRAFAGVLADTFHQLWYESHVWRTTRWLGAPIQKCPFDLLIVQELIHRLRPDVVVETGTMHGGSALFYASLCDLIGNGHVVTIDIKERKGRPEHPRIEYVTGSSTDPGTVERVRSRCEGADTVLVTLDSDHRREHVLAELRSYADLVTPGSYLIVEDTNLNGNPVDPAFGPGPAETIQEFLRERPDFAPDPECERLLLTWNPGGWLRRIR